MPPRPQIQRPTLKVAGRTPTSSAPSVLDRIRPIGFEGAADGINVMLYGAGGTGKTTLWSTFPKPILSIICSGGMNPGETRSIDTPENRETIHQVVLEKADELGTLADAFHDGDQYKTLVLDHVTGFCDLILAEILGVEQLPAQKGWGLASQQQYGQMTLQAKNLIRRMLGTRGNVVIIAQERTFGLSDDGRGEELGISPTVGPGVTPSMAGWLNTAADYVCQTFKRQRTKVVTTKVGNKDIVRTEADRGVDYCLRVGPHSVYHTKFRKPGGLDPAAEVIVNPTYDKIRAMIDGE